MEIKKGGTRIIFIFRNYVIKVPRIKFWFIIKLIFAHLFSGNPFGKVKDHNHKLFFVVKSYILVGFFANIREYKQSKINNDAGVPILKAKRLLLGFIEIQEKGQSFNSKRDPKWRKLKTLFKKNKIRDYDCLSYKNFSLCNGKIYLHDFGGPSTILEIEKIIKLLKTFNSSQAST